jgi:hypothetical protein
MGQRSPKKRHYPIARKLIDGPFVSVNLIHEDLKASIHNLMNFFWVEFFSYGSVVGHISEEYSHQFALSLDGAAGREDLSGQELRGIGLGFRVVYKWGFFGLLQIVTALTAKLILRKNLSTTLRT